MYIVLSGSVVVIERLFWQLGTCFSSCYHCREVVVVERWPLCRGGHCREVAIV